MAKLDWVRDLNQRDVDIEIESKVCVEIVNSGKENLTELDFICGQFCVTEQLSIRGENT